MVFLQAKSPEFKEYQLQVIKNAKVMAKVLMDKGYNVVSGKSYQVRPWNVNWQD